MRLSTFFQKMIHISIFHTLQEKDAAAPIDAPAAPIAAPATPVTAPAINPRGTPVTPPPATVHGLQLSPMEELAMLGAQEDDIEDDDSDSSDEEFEEHARVTCVAELARYKKARNQSPFTKGPDGKLIHNNPLEWWKNNEHKFFHVAAIAKKYLFIPATSSAPSERIFSRAGLIISPLRNRLKPEIAGMLFYVHENWKWYLANKDRFIRE